MKSPDENARLWRWGGAVAVSAVALGLNYLLQPAIGHRTPLLPFVPVAALAGFLLGIGPALLSVALFVGVGAVVWNPGGPVAEVMGLGTTASAVVVFLVLAGTAAVVGGWARRQRNEAIATRERYDAALDATGIVEWEYGLLDGSIDVSPSAARVFGLRATTVAAGRALVPAEDLASMERSIAAAVAGDGPLLLVHRIVHQRTGELRCIETRALVRRDAEGRATHLTGYCMDVTEREQAVQERAAARQRLELALRTSDTIAWACDADRRFTWVFNPIDELRVADGVGQDLLVADHAAAIDRAFETGQPQHLPVIWRTPGGLRHFIAHVEPTLDAAGEVTGLVGALVDVTAQQRLIDDHLANEERLRLAAEAAQLGIWWTDLDAGLTYCTARKLEIYGLGGSEGTIPNEAWLKAIHPDDLPGLLEAWEQARVEGRPYRRRYRIVRGDGTVRWVHTQATFIEDQATGRRRVLGVSADITAEQERERAEAEASRRKDEFLAILAHELRNPLAPIRYAAQLLQHGASAPRVPEIGRMIERQLRHMARLLDDLMDVSRITRGTLELRKEPVDLAAILASAVEAFRVAFDRAGQTVTVHASEAPLPVSGDGVRLLQIVENLLSNANRYTDPGGSIEVTMRREGDWLVLEVADTGVGIPPGSIETIFEPFTQLGARGQASGGLGIGLALARRLAGLHGGELTARSEGLGKGTRMTLRLPAAGAAPASAQVSAGAPSLPDDLRVLVVDDNRDAAEALSAVIEMAGAQPATAFDGRGALELARSWHPDVVLLDLGLPDLSGFEVARELSHPGGNDGAPPHLIAISGWGQPADVERGREAGIEHHFVKPVEAGPLLQYLAGVTRDGGGTKRVQ